MPRIVPGVGVRTLHARKTIAFTGAAGLGAVGTANLFTISGRVLVRSFSAFCTETLVGAGTLDVGVASDADEFIGQIADATTIAANDWLEGTTTLVGASQEPAAQSNVMISENIIATIGSANVTDGTLVFDVWYWPITDGATLVAA